MKGSVLGTAVAVERLRAGRPSPFTTEGISMEPLLFQGYKVRLEPCAAEELRRGDLLAFERQGRVILHRVIGVGPPLVEKGDNAPRPTRVAADQVLGRAVAVLEPRRIDLRSRRMRSMGPWVARLSALHGRVHRLDRLAARHPRARLDLLLRAFDALCRALRRLALGR